MRTKPILLAVLASLPIGVVAMRGIAWKCATFQIRAAIGPRVQAQAHS